MRICPEPSCAHICESWNHMREHISRAHPEATLGLGDGRDLRKLISWLSHTTSAQDDRTGLSTPIKTAIDVGEASTTSPTENLSPTPGSSPRPGATLIAEPPKGAAFSLSESGSEGTSDLVAGQSSEIQNDGSDTCAASQAPVPKHPPQVGIATIRLQILSIRPRTIDETGNDHRGDSSLDFNDEDDEMEDADGGEGGGSGSQSSSAGTGGDSGERGSGSAGRRPDDEPLDQSPSDSRSGSGARKKNKTGDSRPNQRRLACPYDAHEPWLRCGEQGQGFEDLARLRYV